MRAGGRLVVALTATVALLGGVAPTARADSVADAKREAARVQDKLDALSNESVRLADEYEQSLAELDVVKAEVGQLDAQVAELERQVGGLTAAVGNLAVETFIDGDQGGGFASMVASNGSATDIVERQVLAGLATSTGVQSVDTLDALAHELTNTRVAQDLKRRQVERDIASSDQRRAAVEKKTAEYEQLQKQAAARLGQALIDEQKRREAEAEAAARATRPKPVTQPVVGAGATAKTTTVAAAAAATPGGAQAAQPSQQPTRSAPTPTPTKPAPAGAGSQTPPADQAPANPPPADQTPAEQTGNDATPADQTPAEQPPSTDPPADPTPPKPKVGQDVPPPSPGAAGAVEAAMSQLGVPYHYAMAEPGVGFDCSGLTMWAWGQAGVSLPHYSKAQFESLPHVPADQAEPGDLLFYRNPVGHVAMYIGNGQMISAPHTGAVVYISTVNWNSVRDGVVGRPG